MNPGDEELALEDVLEAEAPAIPGDDEDSDGGAQLADKVDAAWGRGDAAGHVWQAPRDAGESWAPTINPWALHQSDAISEWLIAKAKRDASDLAELPGRMRKAIAQRPEVRDECARIQARYSASLQRQLAHIDRLRVLTGDTEALETKGQDVNDDTKREKPKARGPLLNHDRAAAYLGFSPRKLQGLRNSPEGNKGPTYVLMGGSIAYDVNDLDAYVESQKIRSVA